MTSAPGAKRPKAEIDGAKPPTGRVARIVYAANASDPVDAPDGAIVLRPLFSRVEQPVEGVSVTIRRYALPDDVEETGELSVVSLADPDIVEIRLDGVRVLGPMSGVSMRPGQPKLEVFYAGQTLAIRAEIKAGESTHVLFRARPPDAPTMKIYQPSEIIAEAPPPSMGALQIMGDRADVFVDGIRVGATPGYYFASAGKHRIESRIHHHTVAACDVEVTADRVRTIRISEGRNPSANTHCRESPFCAYGNDSFPCP